MHIPEFIFAYRNYSLIYLVIKDNSIYNNQLNQFRIKNFSSFTQVYNITMVWEIHPHEFVFPY